MKKSWIKILLIVFILLIVGYAGWFFGFGEKNRKVVVVENSYPNLEVNNSLEGEQVEPIEQKEETEKKDVEIIGQVEEGIDSKEEKLSDKDNKKEEEKEAEEMNNTEKEEAKEENEDADVDVSIKNRLVNFGFQKASRGAKDIDTIIIHSSYDALGDDPYDVSGLINEYKEYGVAPHYLIDRKGAICKLVEEKNIAWHAGESKVPDGRTGVNNFSVGIELVNTKTDNYTKEQYETLKDLIADIKSRYSIKYVLGHNDISPGRKTDPWNFDWKKIE